MGNGVVSGVPGFEGEGEAIASLSLVDGRWASAEFDDRCPRSGGAGLLDEIRRPGRSILWNLP